LHDGTLRIESVLGVGTTVIVSFPAERLGRDAGGAPEQSCFAYTQGEEAGPVMAATLAESAYRDSEYSRDRRRA
jgi:hypothetical protein